MSNVICPQYFYNKSKVVNYYQWEFELVQLTSLLLGSKDLGFMYLEF